MRPLGRLLAAASIACAVLLAAAGPAGAHAVLRHSDPADASVLDTAPDELILTFNEAVSPDGSAVEIVDVDGGRHEATIVGHGPGDESLRVALGDLPDGLYSIRWTAFSDSDGHITRGMLVWGIGADADLGAADFATPADPVNTLEAVLRWIGFAAAAAVLGALVVDRLVLPRVRARFTSPLAEAWHVESRRRIHRIVRIGAVLAAVASLGIIGHQVWVIASSSGLGLVEAVRTGVLATSWGRWGLVRIVALLVVAVTAGFGSFERRDVAATAAGAIGVAFAAQAAAGHAAGVVHAPFAITNDVVHLVATSAWLGGLYAVHRVLAGPSVERPAGLASATLRHFSPYAALGLGLTVATGWFATGEQVRSIDALVVSGYGRILSAKILLVAVLALLGWANRRALRPRPGRGLRPGLVVAELGVGVAVFALVGVLTASVPATGPEWDRPVDAEARELAVIVDDLQIGLTVTPNVPGQNLLLVDAVNLRRTAGGLLDRIDKVLVRIESLDVDVAPVTEELEPTGDRGEYQLASTAFATPGDYRVSVVVRRVGLADVVADFDWAVSTRSPRPVTVSAAPLRPYAGALGLAAAAAVIVALAGERIVARRRERAVAGVAAYLADVEADAPASGVGAGGERGTAREVRS